MPIGPANQIPITSLPFIKPGVLSEVERKGADIKRHRPLIILPSMAFGGVASQRVMVLRISSKVMTIERD